MYRNNESLKEKMIEEDKAVFAKLKQEMSNLLDGKREKEFEEIMLEEASKTQNDRF